MKYTDVQNEAKKYADPKRAKVLQTFFKCGKGEYGEGDVFVGITVPECRRIAKQFVGLSFVEVGKLMKSKIHEERLIALLILVEQFQKGDDAQKENIYTFYLKNTQYINNWDLVDLSSHKIVGAYLYGAPRAEAKKTLQRLAVSKNLWERRIAIIATYYFIAHSRYGETPGIAQMLRNDTHDLIHKAVGWMLREVGKRNKEVEERFLRKYYKTMPRTMLRYAIEKFGEAERKKYLGRD